MTARKIYKTKAEWAGAMAKDLQERADKLRYTSSHGSTSQARRKYEAVKHLQAEADRYRRMAAKYLEQGR